MIDTTAIFFIIVLIICEIFESWWQSAPTFGGVIEKIRGYYYTNIFLLFFMHPSFYVALFAYLYYGGATASVIVIMKTVDIATKLWLVQKVEEGSLSPEFKAMFSMPLSPVMMWMNVFIYPALLAFSVA
ncbi:hypothetical protein [Hydrogenimonas thermophila]|uniref:Uncharacterized protein n=1 Tax=Hydrogenimonas thermophila TaxID=223786 RepID=A0A1I5S595_9BACT|nr:hypothetical protein [Hydrogenimonas thermophila]SFP65791.1 hypothetical protein SAMN05216234_1312 [Hydrogenimonas thermophila]